MENKEYSKMKIEEYNNVKKLINLLIDDEFVKGYLNALIDIALIDMKGDDGK